MSLVITLHVREGIVMAADSRLTLNQRAEREDGPVLKLAVGQSDSNTKLFLAPNEVGISTFGSAAIQGVPIAGFIESFFDERLGADDPVEETARKLLEFFREQEPIPESSFHVAGYSRLEGELRQQVWRIDVAEDEMREVSSGEKEGAAWGGDVDILARLIQPVATLDDDGEIDERLPDYKIPWAFFTLQDAIDFAIFAMRSTIDAIRFEPRPKTVGGPIDVLVIRPTGTEWIQRKRLHGEEPPG